MGVPKNEKRSLFVNASQLMSTIIHPQRSVSHIFTLFLIKTLIKLKKHNKLVIHLNLVAQLESHEIK